MKKRYMIERCGFVVSLEFLNNRYLSLIENQKLLLNLQSRIEQNSQNDGSYSVILDEFISFSKNFEKLDFKLLDDIISLALLYKKCDLSIKEYSSALLVYASDNSNLNKSNVTAAESKVMGFQKEFDNANDAFGKKYGFVISSLDVMVNTILKFIENENSLIKKKLDEILDEVRKIMCSEPSLELNISKKLTSNETLPKELPVAKCLTGKTEYAVLREVGISNTYSIIMNDLKNNGNVLVKVSQGNIDTDNLDSLVIAYIFQIIESFPLDSVNVHIFDKNISYLYRLLCNSFQSENAGELTKNVVQLHSSINDLQSLGEIVCNDVVKKLSTSASDLYAVYNTDKSDVFNLIILKDGLVDSNGYAAADMLDMIKSFTTPSETAHRCGMRFLLLDNSDSFEGKLADNTKALLSSIGKNCALKIDYSEHGFMYDDKSIKVLRIADNIESFIQNRANDIAGAISRKERSYVSLDDIQDVSYTEQNGSILYIPIGKIGNEIVQLPLSCKDDNGTVAGQCIGYMTIGSSGSGKSSFFHSVVLNSCFKYSPKELQFWLLDFKFGGASSKYKTSELPHIKFVAENNKIDDALCLFQMIKEEMDRRNKAFNSCFVDNIVDYNKKALYGNLEYFPRVIVLIDEVQEIFRDDNASALQNMISANSVRMRSAGMHFIMVAQNLSEGRSHLLRESFLPSASGRVCFRMEEDTLRDSAFGDEYTQRKHEISELKTGEAYISYGKGTIKKVKIAYASPEDMASKYFPQIKEKYKEYDYMKPLVIGSKERLTVNSRIQKSRNKYADEICSLKCINGNYRAVIGEDAYRLDEKSVVFSQNNNSSVLLLGDNKVISSSLCTSIAASLIRQNVRIYLFNGDKTKITSEMDSYEHAFMHLCQNVTEFTKVNSYRLNQFSDVVRDMYKKYLERKKAAQEADNDIPIFPAEFLIVNDLFNIDCFANNELIEDSKQNETNFELPSGNTYNILGNNAFQHNGSSFRVNCQEIINILLQNGYRYNLHLVLAISGSSSAWRCSNVVREINNIVMFNPTQYAGEFENSYYLKEMLKNISNQIAEETMAVWIGRQMYSKIRPIVYDLSVPAEVQILNSIISEE